MAIKVEDELPMLKTTTPPMFCALNLKKYFFLNLHIYLYLFIFFWTNSHIPTPLLQQDPPFTHTFTNLTPQYSNCRESDSLTYCTQLSFLSVDVTYRQKVFRSWIIQIRFPACRFYLNHTWHSVSVEVKVYPLRDPQHNVSSFLKATVCCLVYTVSLIWIVKL
jgi:hypothetical protein